MSRELLFSEPAASAAPRTRAGRLFLAYEDNDDESAGNDLGHLIGQRHWSKADVVLAIEAEAAALAARPDATVIRRAIRNVVDADPSVWLEQGDMADAVAAEYARLASITVEEMTDALLAVRLGCEGDDQADQKASTRYYAARLLSRLSGPTEPEDK